MSSLISVIPHFNFLNDLLEPKIKNDIFQSDDWDFIKSVSSRFPERTPSVMQRFLVFSYAPEKERPMLALEMLKNEPRRGLIQRGYAQEEVESVYDHTRNMSRMLGKIFRENSEARSSFPGNRARKILVHDIGEAITTDFTPRDMDRISAGEKVRLEDLAMKLIFGEDSPRYRAYVSYKNKATRDDELVKVTDTLEFLEDTGSMNVSPEIQQEISENSRHVLNKYKGVCDDLRLDIHKL